MNHYNGQCPGEDGEEYRPLQKWNGIREWSTVPASDARITRHLSEELDQRATVLIDQRSRWGKSHLRLHKDAQGFFVRQGRRGGCKRRIVAATLVYAGETSPLFSFQLDYM